MNINERTVKQKSRREMHWSHNEFPTNERHWLSLMSGSLSFSTGVTQVGILFLSHIFF